MFNIKNIYSCIYIFLKRKYFSRTFDKYFLRLDIYFRINEDNLCYGLKKLVMTYRCIIWDGNFFLKSK